MYDTTIAAKLLGQLESFLGRISPHFHKPVARFIGDMIYGIMVEKDVKLSSIVRALKEKTTPKKVEDRLSRMLSSAGLEAGLHGVVPVRLPDIPDRLLHMVVVRGFGKKPMMLLTTLAKTTTREALWQVVEGYITRWRIEDTIRHVKQSYNLEDMRLFKYGKIKALAAVVLATIYFSMAWIGNSEDDEPLAAAYSCAPTRNDSAFLSSDFHLTQNGNRHFTLCFQGRGDFHASKIGEPPSHYPSAPARPYHIDRITRVRPSAPPLPNRPPTLQAFRSVLSKARSVSTQRPSRLPFVPPSPQSSIPGSTRILP